MTVRPYSIVIASYDGVIDSEDRVPDNICFATSKVDQV